MRETPKKAHNGKRFSISKICRTSQPAVITINKIYSFFLYKVNIGCPASYQGTSRKPHESRNKAIEELPALEKFWNDERLRSFMEKTQGDGFPPTPKESEIAPLIQAISLVSGSDRSEKSFKGKEAFYPNKRLKKDWQIRCVSLPTS